MHHAGGGWLPHPPGEAFAMRGLSEQVELRRLAGGLRGEAGADGGGAGEGACMTPKEKPGPQARTGLPEESIFSTAATQHQNQAETSEQRCGWFRHRGDCCYLEIVDGQTVIIAKVVIFQPTDPESISDRK